MQCSACDYQSDGIGDLSRHRNAAHADLRKKYKKRKKKAVDDTPPVEKPELDAELTTIVGCAAIIDEQLEQLDSDGLARVTAYLTQRYAPAAVLTDG